MQERTWPFVYSFTFEEHQPFKQNLKLFINVEKL